MRGRKYRVENTLETLKNYIQVRAKKYPEIFLHLLPSSIVIKEDCIRKLKIAGLDGVTIFATRVEWWPPLDSGHGWDEIIPKIVVAADMVLLAPKGMDLLRVDCIVDMEGFNRHHFQRLFGIRPCIKMMNLFYKAFPLRLRTVHFVNSPSCFDMFFVVAKKLLPKYMNRVILHSGNLDTLHRYIPRDTLPTCWNGKLSLENAIDPNFNKDILNNEHFYEKLQQCIRKYNLKN
ncbi:alpha-tocopherol transfer protein-like isoform X2 [Folsomia candida]|nr:alpha-tocopherol transfer protein-like isoform X2 [Folsomia candida]XP_035701152.1 alpha-tocopherol transfer protein-like isoform X2 [Folsomia candida]